MPPSVPRPVNSMPPAALEGPSRAGHYERGPLLGEGGMGLVYSAQDEVIGREVALKILRDETDGDVDVAARFVREARIQGQLDHPSIVPVYALGRMEDGTPYFTMKRVRGVSLADAIGLHAAGDAADAETYSRHRLLADFVRVCLAVEFAHERGVIHRDIKPANIMLGSYGEVHLLDWGVAKTLVHDEATGGAPLRVDAVKDGASSAAILGTPGYVAPEQVRVGLVEVDTRADVYSLGAVLFEILAGEPLHGGRTPADRLASTLGAGSRSPRERAPSRDVPPELDRLVLQATEPDRAARLASARALADGVDRFLKGDRDAAARKQASAEHAARAAELTESALRAKEELRPEALNEVGRALALDPDNTVAKTSLVKLLTEPPAVPPQEVERDIERATAETATTSLRSISAAYGSWLLFVPLILLPGIANVGFFVTVVGLGVLTATTAYLLSQKGSPNPRSVSMTMALAGVAIATMSLLFGPFLVAPIVAGANAIGYSLMPVMKRRHAVLGSALAIGVPYALEKLGLLPPSTVFHAGTIELLPRLMSFSAPRTEIVLLLMTIGAATIPSLSVAHIREALARNEQRLLVQSWQLRRLVTK